LTLVSMLRLTRMKAVWIFRDDPFQASELDSVSWFQFLGRRLDRVRGGRC
jgi:hypothetical protein